MSFINRSVAIIRVKQPKDIAWNKFIGWFDLEFHTEVIDTTAGEIEKDPTPMDLF